MRALLALFLILSPPSFADVIINTCDGSLMANEILPAQTGNSGKFLTTDGTNSSWGTPSGGGGGTPTVYAYSGYISLSNTNYYNTTSASLVDLTVVGSPSLVVQKNTNFGTVSISASNKAGVSFASAPATGTLRVCFSVTFGNALNTAQAQADLQLFEINSSTLIAQAIQESLVNTFVAIPSGNQCGHFAVTAGSPYEFRVKAKTSDGTLYLGSYGSAFTTGGLAFNFEYLH